MSKQILILIGVVIAIGFFVASETGIFESVNHKTQPKTTLPSFNHSQPDNFPNESLVTSNTMSLNDKLSNGLIKAGWESNAAHTVVALNQEWFEILQTVHPQALEKQVHLLKDLGNYPHFMPLFKAHPETAALLAGADDPDKIVQSLEWDQCYDIMMGLFAQHAAPEDTAALANALAIHRSLMCRLIMRGLLGSQALFIFPRDNPGAQEYDHWLAEVLDHALSQSDEKLSTLINLLFEQGTIIRGKMIDDPPFRYTFRHDLWPKLIRVSNKTQQPVELYLSEPHLWDLLALPQGERLLEQWIWFLSLEQIYNLTPAEVLFGKEAYPTPLHPFIIDAILDEDANTLIPLLDFGHTPLFVKLMQRQLPEEVKQKAFNTLIAKGPNYPTQLEDWDKASDADLHFELVNDGSSLTHTLKKTIQGREVSGGEAFWATLDMADIAFTVATFGTGTLVTSSVKLGAKKGVKSLSKSQAKHFFQQNPITKKIAQKLSDNVFISTATKQFIQKMQPVFRKMNGQIPEHATVEITPALQFFFKKMNVNRKTLKRINNRWDARLFMRKDAKVLVNVDYKQLSSATCLFFRVTAATNITGVSGTVAREVVCGLADSLDNIEDVKVTYKWATSINSQQPFKIWQKNKSAWWLMNASNMTAR